MKKVERGERRRANPDVFLSHSSKDKNLALKLAIDLNFCGVDVWLDEWEIQIGQSLVDVLADSLNNARYVAILISENYNKSVWTKAEYRKALAREQREGRVVMLPLMLGQVELPDFLEEKMYLDLRTEYYSGVARLASKVHNLSEFRITRALRKQPPQSVKDIWNVFLYLGFEPFVVFGGDDFEEILKHGGSRTRGDYVHFFPDQLLDSVQVSDHVKALIRELFPLRRGMHLTAEVRRGSAREPTAGPKRKLHGPRTPRPTGETLLNVTFWNSAGSSRQTEVSPEALVTYLVRLAQTSLDLGDFATAGSSSRLPIRWVLVEKKATAAWQALDAKARDAVVLVLSSKNVVTLRDSSLTTLKAAGVKDGMVFHAYAIPAPGPIGGGGWNWGGDPDELSTY